MGHLTLKQRYKIESYREIGKSLSQIAEYVGKDRSVISRELSRNSDMRSGGYSAELAHRKAEKRKKEKPKRRDFTDEVKTNVLY